MKLALHRLALVAVFITGFSLAAASANAESPAGVYVGQIEGQTVALLLESDGSASLLGERGTWKRSQGGVILSSDGQSVRAALKGGSIVFVVDGVRFALQKQVKSGAVRPTPTPTGQTRSPRQQLKGKRFNVTGVNASFVVPKGWNASYGEQDGKSGIAITNRKFPGVVFVVTATMLSRQQARSTVPQLLQLSARAVLGDTPVQVVRGPEEFRIDGKDAGQLILKDSNGAQTIVGRFGGIKIGRWGVGFVAFYQANLDTTVAPVFETVLASFRGKAPKANKALAAQIAGCWESYSGETSGTGSSSISSTYRFDRQGRYAYRYSMNASIPGGSGVSDGSKASGSFAVYGKELFLVSEAGESSSFVVRFHRGRLHLGSNRYAPCS